MIAVMIPDLKPPSPAARTAAFAVLESLREVISLMEDQVPAGGYRAGICEPSISLSISLAWLRALT